MFSVRFSVRENLISDSLVRFTAATGYEILATNREFTGSNTWGRRQLACCAFVDVLCIPNQGRQDACAPRS